MQAHLWTASLLLVFFTLLQVELGRCDVLQVGWMTALMGKDLDSYKGQNGHF